MALKQVSTPTKKTLRFPVTMQENQGFLSGERGTPKVRAMVVRKDLLVDLPAQPLVFESPHHSVRWTTLLQLRKAYASETSNFIEAEIVT